jgi:hypothetical protein
MAINVKGHEFEAVIVKDSFERRATQYKNNIISNLRKLGLTEDDVTVELEKMPFKKAQATAKWYLDGHLCHYDYKFANKFVDNLFVVQKIIEIEVNLVLSEKKHLQDFINDFKEEEDLDEKRIEARKTLGLSQDTLDLNEIDRAYKEKAKEHHPDAGGNIDKFKEINTAHKILKRELQ